MRLTLNLATQIYLPHRRLYSGYAFLGLLLVALLILNGATLLRSIQHGDQLDSHLDELQQAGQKTVSGADDATLRQKGERIDKEIARAEELIEADAFRWTALLDRLEKLLPGRVRIVGLTPEYRAGNLKIEGEAMEIEALKAFLDALLAADDFSQAYLLDHTALAPPASGIHFSLVVKGVF